LGRLNLGGPGPWSFDTSKIKNPLDFSSGFLYHNKG